MTQLQQLHKEFKAIELLTQSLAERSCRARQELELLLAPAPSGGKRKKKEPTLTQKQVEEIRLAVRSKIKT